MSATEMQGRFRVYYDYDRKIHILVVQWGEAGCNRSSRDISEAHAEHIKQLMMGGFYEETKPKPR